MSDRVLVNVVIFLVIWFAGFGLAASRSVPRAVPFLSPLALAAMFVSAWKADADSQTGDSQGGLIATVGIWTVAISLILVIAGLAVRSRRSRH